MKKIYMSPAMDIIELKKQTLLAGSAPGLGGDLGGSDPILSPELDTEELTDFDLSGFLLIDVD